MCIYLERRSSQKKPICDEDIVVHDTRFKQRVFSLIRERDHNKRRNEKEETVLQGWEQQEGGKGGERKEREEDRRRQRKKEKNGRWVGPF